MAQNETTTEVWIEMRHRRHLNERSITVSKIHINRLARHLPASFGTVCAVYHIVTPPPNGTLFAP